MKKAFTLIELLVVVAIIGILATVVIFNVASARSKASEAKVQAEISEANKAVAICFAGGGKAKAPGSAEGGGDVCDDRTITDAIWPTLSGASNYTFNDLPSCRLNDFLSATYSCSATTNGLSPEHQIPITPDHTGPPRDIPNPPDDQEQPPDEPPAQFCTTSPGSTYVFPSGSPGYTLIVDNCPKIISAVSWNVPGSAYCTSFTDARSACDSTRHPSVGSSYGATVDITFTDNSHESHSWTIRGPSM